MKNVALASVAMLALACSGREYSFDSDSEPVEQGRPATFIPDPGFVAPSSAPSVDAVPDAYFAGEGQELDVNGRLEGQLNYVTLSGDTTQNWGYVLDDGEGDGAPGYASFRVETDTPQGAAMVMVDFEGGLQHPVFRDGAVSSEQPEAAGIYIMSCTGPEMGDYPDEQSPSRFEATVTRDPEAQTVALALDAEYPSTMGGETPLRSTFVFADPNAE